MAKIYSLVVTGVNSGQFVQNVLHYQSSETGSFDAYDWASDLIDSWIVAHQGLFLLMLASDYHLLSYRARRVSSPGGPTVIKLANDAGAHAGTTDTAGASVESAFPVVVAGKNVTGKFYVPGVPGGTFVENQLDNSYSTVVHNFAQSLLTPLTGSTTSSTYDFGVYRRPKSSPPTPEAFTVATHTYTATHPVNIKRRNVPA